MKNIIKGNNPLTLFLLLALLIGGLTLTACDVEGDDDDNGSEEFEDDDEEENGEDDDDEEDDEDSRLFDSTVASLELDTNFGPTLAVETTTVNTNNTSITQESQLTRHYQIL